MRLVENLDEGATGVHRSMMTCTIGKGFLAPFGQ
jgi:hypothetical protein